MKSLYIKIHWMSLSSKPVVLSIQGLELVVSPLERKFWKELMDNDNKFEVLEKKVL
jgi:predicted DNA-binding ribbon-helix-helix protein